MRTVAATDRAGVRGYVHIPHTELASESQSCLKALPRMDCEPMLCVAFYCSNIEEISTFSLGK